MIAKRLTAQNGQKLLARFYAAHGPEQMKASYGWSSPDSRMLLPGEKVFEFFVHRENGQVPRPLDSAGFGVIHLNTQDAMDEEAILTIGVWPEQQRKGYHLRILKALCDKSRELGASFASMCVKKTNTAHYNRTMMASALPGQPRAAEQWIYAGDITYPGLGYGYFVMPLEEEKA